MSVKLTTKIWHHTFVPNHTVILFIDFLVTVKESNIFKTITMWWILALVPKWNRLDLCYIMKTVVDHHLRPLSPPKWNRLDLCTTNNNHMLAVIENPVFKQQYQYLLSSGDHEYLCKTSRQIRVLIQTLKWTNWSADVTINGAVLHQSNDNQPSSQGCIWKPSRCLFVVQAL